MPGVELVELTDERDRTLMVSPRVGVRRMVLARRVVLVAFFDMAKRLYVQKRAVHCDAMPGFWDLSATGHAHAGEAREDAARRELFEEIGIRAARMLRVGERSPTAESNSFSTLYIAGPSGDIPTPNPEEVEGGMFLDREEVLALIAYTPETITPALRWAVEQAAVFDTGRKRTKAAGTGKNSSGASAE